MKKVHNINKLLVASMLALTLYSCGSNSNNNASTEEPKKMADSPVAVKTPTPPPPPAFSPFNVVLITHTVKNYSKWRVLFDADSTNRKSAGMENIVIGRGANDSNQILVVLKVADVQKAKDFSNSPQLKETMKKAGVISKPAISIFNVIRNEPGNSKEWIEITHKVKDFDAWVKVYDAEGKEKRASEGMVDAVLARGVDDPNLVHIVFEVTDMAKAKVALSSEEKKKLMMSAGVEGKPEIAFFRSAD